MTSFLGLFASLCFTFLQLITLYRTFASGSPVDPTKGFTSLPLDASNYDVQWPYNVPKDQRYSFVDGVHKMWVFKTDKPHTRTSRTKPRTEIGIHGYGYTSGIWQFEGYGFVPNGTTGVCIMQIFGASPPHASTLMMRVYNGNLMYYQDTVLVHGIYDKWFRLNVIHNADTAKVKIFIDGNQLMEANGRGGDVHTFKFGVYSQVGDSPRMESHWKGIKVLKKT